MDFAIDYVLLDGARMRENLDRALELNTEGKSLHSGKAENRLAAVAPYLFNFDSRSEFANFLIEKNWASAWGIFISCSDSFANLIYHLRKFLKVKTEDERELYFRFYDPRVLRLFLPTCDEKQFKHVLFVKKYNLSYCFVYIFE